MSLRLAIAVVALVGIGAAHLYAQDAYVGRDETGFFMTRTTVSIDDEDASAFTVGLNYRGRFAGSLSFSDAGSAFLNVSATHLTVAAFLMPPEVDKSSFSIAADAEYIWPEDNSFVAHVLGLGSTAYYTIHLGSVFRLQPYGGFMMYLPESEDGRDIDDASLIFIGGDLYLRPHAPIAIGGGVEYGQYSQNGENVNASGVNLNIVFFPSDLSK